MLSLRATLVNLTYETDFFFTTNHFSLNVIKANNKSMHVGFISTIVLLGKVYERSS